MRLLTIFFKKLQGQFFALGGAAIMVAGWNWYHVKHRPHDRFLLISLAAWVALFIGFRIATLVYAYLVRRFKRHPYWQESFRHFLDKLFFLVSFLFLIFFINHKIFSLVYVSALFLLCYLVLARQLKKHPAAGWFVVHRELFIFGYAIFLLQAIIQYVSFRYYILDSNAQLSTIVFFRAFSMTMFWLLGFVIGSFLLVRFRSAARYVVYTLWSLFFIFVLFVWSVNVGILYYSGIHISPIALQHAEGAGTVLANRVSLLLLIVFIITALMYGYILRRFYKIHRAAAPRYWYFYQGGVAVLALCSLFGLASFKNTPERAVFHSFYHYYFGGTGTAPLSGTVQKKLEQFGLFYSTSSYYVGTRDFVYNPSSTQKLLTKQFKETPPNIIILFLESFSARLTSVYNSSTFPGLTPGFEEMARDKNTTVFKKFYNASTPTITGIWSQLCSFLPPTGHTEIQRQRAIRHKMLCLPEVLRTKGGYAYSGYVTAVAKDYAHKDEIFASMGTDEVLGEEELKKHISGEPLSWGYSDHQLMPALGRMMQKTPQPFLLMLSTVDTHTPFDYAKDKVPYGDSKSAVLDMFHTTDDAFLAFWREFKQSSFATNTIVVAVADHGIFPSEFTKNLFPQLTGKLNYYDENAFLMYVPDSVLPRVVDQYSSGLDIAPTLLHMLGINVPNSFEGHSIFGDRAQYPNLLGMHEFGLYINQADSSGKRVESYDLPSRITCPKNYVSDPQAGLNLCDFLQFYNWKRRMFEEGRFWKS